MSGLLPEMGKHAAFIWVALGVAMGAMTLMALTSWRRMRAAETAAEAARAAREDS